MIAAIVKVDHSGQATPREVAQAALTALIEHAGQDGVTEGDRVVLADLLDMSQEHAMDVFAGRHGDGPLWNKMLLLARHRATAFAAGKAARDREV